MVEKEQRMIYPTEMTVATGTVTYSGDPESDERIRSREVRVSVTFQIEDEDADLADLAFAKAAEVERARLAACDRIKRYHPDCEYPAFDTGDPSLEPPDNENENYDGSAPEPVPVREVGPDVRCRDADEAIRVTQDSARDSGHVGNSTHVVSRPVPSWTPPDEMNKASDTETDWATKPQVLALGSHFRRLGIGHSEQTALLRSHFGKFRTERLTRKEAAELMRYLERGECEPSGPTTY